MTLSERLRERMSELGDEGPTDLMNRTGLKYATAHDILSGKTAAPSARTLEVLATHYRVTPEWLLNGDRGGSSDPVAELINALQHDVVGRLGVGSRRDLVRAGHDYALESFTPEQLRRFNRWSEEFLNSEDEQDPVPEEHERDTQRAGAKRSAPN